MAPALTTLVSFSGADGTSPETGLIADANGDPFGTATSGGASGDGAVFEITKTAGGYASTPSILVSFDGANGAFPVDNLIADSNGDLFGTTTSGVASNRGTVFEIKKTAGSYASTPTTLVSFDGSNGAKPDARLIADSNGDLFGTNSAGGASNVGTVFEIKKTAGGYANSPTTLVSFNPGASPATGLIADANGDLFGTTQFGGARFFGTVFEIKKTNRRLACWLLYPLSAQTDARTDGAPNESMANLAEV